MPRITRSEKTRDATVRTAGMRQMPTVVDTSPLWIDRSQIPDGMEYMWVRYECLGMPDRSRMSQVLRAGWSPVPSSRHPTWGDPLMPGEKAEPDDNIRRGGLILMEIPLKYVEAHKAELHDENLDIMGSIRDAFPDGVMNETGGGLIVERNVTGIERVRQTFKED